MKEGGKVIFKDTTNCLMLPSKALQIATKITRGTIEMLNEVHIIKKDERVEASAATLLGMLNIHPFAYGLSILQVYIRRDEKTVFGSVPRIFIKLVSSYTLDNIHDKKK